MFSLTNIPSTTRVLSAYTSVAASAMLVRTVASEVQSLATQLIPQQVQGKLISTFGGLFGQLSSQITLVIHEYDGVTLNQMFEASEQYLRTKINPSVERLRVWKIPREKNLLVTAENGQEIIDIFQGIQLKWKLSCTVVQTLNSDYEGGFNTSSSEKKHLELSFHKKHKKIVMDSYLPHVLEVSKAIREENRTVKIYSLGFYGGEDGGGVWGSTKLDHPSTFDTLAMDSKDKKELLEDLDRFVRRKKYYRRVGKAWKRGYLLYGPPGTGKSSLIAAMANHLNFNVYDLELANLRSNSELQRLLVATTNRSILVIEDIDCTIELQDRLESGGAPTNGSQLTLSGLLNFIDGLWSSCGDERIIVFTTNHKDRLDPALLRPGRMDMHIHMSYCTPCGFKLLASNYLMINNHSLFKVIEVLLEQVNVTPAEVAEEMMRSDDAETSLKGLINLLNSKKIEQDGSNVEDGKEDDQESKRQKVNYKNQQKIKRNTRTKMVKCHK